MSIKRFSLPLAYFVAGIVVGPRSADCATLTSIQPLTDQVLMVQVDDGAVYYHHRDQPRTQEIVDVRPLDVAKAVRAESFGITSIDDSFYAELQHPLSVGRKTKGTQFAWHVDAMANGQVTNLAPDSSSTHWLYLVLPAPLRAGCSYRLSTGDLVEGGSHWDFKFEPTRSRSEAVHVNTVGYRPDAPEKFGYLYHWQGDRGSLDLSRFSGRPFVLIDQANGSVAFTGAIRFRRGKENPETSHPSDSPPWGNFLNADVWECDFSGFSLPGVYVLSVEGIGCSWPFRIDADVYRTPFREVTRALYHNRSGIALTSPYTEFVRPAPHNPRLTPGFAGRLFYTSVRFTEWGSEGGDAQTLRAGRKGTIESSGWYQDAGDWDSYVSHLRVAQELLFAFELAPANFAPRELNLPESADGLPDILNEAAWLPRFCYRLRHELIEKGYGTGGIGLRIAGDAFGTDEKQLPGGHAVGQASWEDVDRDWAASGEDPWSTYRYAGAAAHLAYALRLVGRPDPEGIDWMREARESYVWAQNHTRAGDETNPEIQLADYRCYAAAALFRMTGEKGYEKQVVVDTSGLGNSSLIRGDSRYGPWLYALTNSSVGCDPATQARVTSAVVHSADVIVLQSAARRSLRWGGDFEMPMLVGQQTTPLVFDGAVASVLERTRDPAKASAFFGALCTTCDYFFGTNALNQTWITGVGPRYPAQMFHMDAWYNGKGRFQPGLTPYGPWRKERDLGLGPWDQAWPHKTVYPALDSWPGNERWFSNRCAPMTCEFTIHEQNAPEAALFGFLCAPAATKIAELASPANGSHP